MGVSVRPGAITFTRVPRGASSRARVRTRACTPALAAEYAKSPSPGRIASDEPVARRTPPWGTKCLRAARNVRSTPVRFTAKTRFHSSRLRSKTVAGGNRTPALAWATLKTPNSFASAATALDSASASDTSAALAAAREPMAPTSWTKESRADGSRPIAATRAPSSAARRAVCRPIPVSAPVMSTTRPASLPGGESATVTACRPGDESHVGWAAGLCPRENGTHGSNLVIGHSARSAFRKPDIESDASSRATLGWGISSGSSRSLSLPTLR